MVRWSTWILASLILLSGCSWIAQSSTGNRKAPVTYRLGPFVLDTPQAPADIGLLLEEQIRHKVWEGTDWVADAQNPRLDVQGRFLSYEWLSVARDKGDKPSFNRLRISAQIRILDHRKPGSRKQKLLSAFADIPYGSNFRIKEDSLCREICEDLGEEVFRELLDLP